MLRALILVALASPVDVFAEDHVDSGRLDSGRSCPKFAVELVTAKRDYNVGEQWVCELKATATAQGDAALTIRSWARFFAEYDVVPDVHGPFDQANLSDVLSTGGQVWRDGSPVILWNSPKQEVFGKSSRTSVPAGSSVSVKFKHHFGAAIKPGRYRQKVWWAIVVEPSPDHFMLLFARKPVDVEFIVRGEPITFDAYEERFDEWFKANGNTLHDSQPISSSKEDSRR